MGKKALNKKQINQIIKLREHGYSLPEIKQVTHFGGGTIFKYIQGIKILPEFRETWKNKRKSSVARMIKEQHKARNQADLIIRKIGKTEKVIM